MWGSTKGIWEVRESHFSPLEYILNNRSQWRKKYENLTAVFRHCVICDYEEKENMNEWRGYLTKGRKKEEKRKVIDKS